jgi:hypothetical protein
MEEVAVSEHEIVVDKTKAMEAAIHAALDAADDYLETIRSLLAAQQAADAPNKELVGRYGQFIKRATNIIEAIEDGPLNDLNFCLDRLFAVDLAERGEFI